MTELGKNDVSETPKSASKGWTRTSKTPILVGTKLAKKDLRWSRGARRGPPEAKKGVKNTKMAILMKK
jgi:hypothetical protein